MADTVINDAVKIYRTRIAPHHGYAVMNDEVIPGSVCLTFAKLIATSFRRETGILKYIIIMMATTRRRRTS